MRPDQRTPVRLRRTLAVALLLAAPAIAPAQGAAPARRVPLVTATGLRPHNVRVEPVTHAGRRGVRVTVADGARQRIDSLRGGQSRLETLVIVEGTDFGDGTIELEVAGAPAAGASGGARGFVGIAFRVQPDLATYDAFYLRPTNGRADDQVRRNHSAQYIAHPDWPWERLRRETPERYESYVDLVPGAWTRVRVEVRGDTARLYVHGQPQPTLVVHDVKSGRGARGALALWIGPETVAHFRDLRVSR